MTHLVFLLLHSLNLLLDPCVDSASGRCCLLQFLGHALLHHFPRHRIDRRHDIGGSTLESGTLGSRIVVAMQYA